MTTCNHCQEPVMMRCRKHGGKLCGGLYCTNLHRWVDGDCEFVSPNRFEPVDWVVAFGAAIVVLTGVAIVWSHL